MQPNGSCVWIVITGNFKFKFKCGIKSLKSNFVMCTTITMKQYDMYKKENHTSNNNQKT